MVDEERYCIDIITQSSSIKGTLTGIEGFILEIRLTRMDLSKYGAVRRKEPSRKFKRFINYLKK